jgi:hypothetical protein
MWRGRDACISRRLIRPHFALAYSPAFPARLLLRHFAPGFCPCISRPLIASAFCSRIFSLHFAPVFRTGILLPDFVPAFRAGILLPDFTPVVSAGGFRFGDSRPEGCSIGAVKENRLRILPKAVSFWGRAAGRKVLKRGRMRWDAVYFKSLK